MKLRAARINARLTQVQVAKEAKIAERMYQEYEYDNSEPSVRTAIRIADALDVIDLRELFTPVPDDPNLSPES